MIGEPGGDLLSHMKYALSSARLRFTVLFGKGRGGSTSLWTPDLKGVRRELAKRSRGDALDSKEVKTDTTQSR